MSVKRSKGNTLIEVLVAMFVVTVTITASATVFTGIYNSRNIMEELEDGLYKSEGVKKLLICNFSYEEIMETFKEKKLYINDYNLNDFNFSQGILLEDLDITSKGYPHLTIEGEERPGGTMKILMVFHFDTTRKIESVFYKGRYEEVQ